MRLTLPFGILFLLMGCAPKEESPSEKGKCEADFTLDFTLADGSTEQVALSACDFIDVNAGFEFGDEPHLRYVGLGLQSTDSEACALDIKIDPFCGNASYIFDGPTGYAALGTLVLDDCPGMPEGADTTIELSDGDVSLTVGYKDPGSSPGKTIKSALNGTINADGANDDITVAITGEFKIERLIVTGEVDESICD